jgi:DNA-binding IscR family transcriptional regulator
VADIIQAIDGPLTMTSCSTDDEQCEQFTKCNVRDPLWRIKDRIVAALATCSLAEIASDTPVEETVMPLSLTRGTTRPAAR